jgi:hypothetical protein
MVTPPHLYLLLLQAFSADVCDAYARSVSTQVWLYNSHVLDQYLLPACFEIDALKLLRLALALRHLLRALRLAGAGAAGSQHELPWMT